MYKYRSFFTIGSIILFVFISKYGLSQDTKQRYWHIIFTSDVHFGIKKKKFREAKDVDAKIVNEAMVQSMDHLSEENFPKDDGLQSGDEIKYIDYLIITGDITNRMQIPVQTAKKSWDQFQNVYLNGLSTDNYNKQKTPILLLAGNHDVSNAIGYYKEMIPKTDPSAYIGIYNLMHISPARLTTSNFSYYDHPINYSKDIAGIHFMFINIWPDSSNLIWMEKDLEKINNNTPVILFAHDPPEGVPYHFSGSEKDSLHIWKNLYENLLSERLQDEPKDSIPTNYYEQRLFVNFLKKHPNIKAYFHGHENYTEFYSYHGPDNNINLPIFRVDSPMKGNISKKKEKKLAYEVIDIDTSKRLLTVRECLWNKEKMQADVQWGESKTINY